MKIILNDIQGRKYRCPNCNTKFIATSDSWYDPTYAREKTTQHSQSYCPRCNTKCISPKSDPFITIPSQTMVIDVVKVSVS